MEWLNNILNFILTSLLQELVVVIAGVIVAQIILSRWDRWRYGGWKVVVTKNQQEILRRDISPGKAKQILQEPADLSVFLKGVVSPYAQIHCDLIEEGQKIGLLVEDPLARQFTIALDRNPPRSNHSPPTSF